MSSLDPVGILIDCPGISYYTWVKSSETAQVPPRKDVDLEALGNRKSEEDSDDEVTVVFEAPEKEKA